MKVCQNPLVPALDAGPQKDRPYQSDFYRAGFNAIPRQAREQDSFDTPSFLRHPIFDSDLFYCYSQRLFQILCEFLYILEPFAGVFKPPFAPTGTTIICIAVTRAIGTVS